MKPEVLLQCAVSAVSDGSGLQTNLHGPTRRRSFHSSRIQLPSHWCVAVGALGVRGGFPCSLCKNQGGSNPGASRTMEKTDAQAHNKCQPSSANQTCSGYTETTPYALHLVFQGHPPCVSLFALTTFWVREKTHKQTKSTHRKPAPPCEKQNVGLTRLTRRASSPACQSVASRPASKPATLD